jgi:hypothetical protein
VPNWAASLSGISQATDALLITPLPLNASEHTQIKLLTTRQADGSLLGKLVIYTPTPAYHNAKQGKYSVEDFTGTVIYTNLAGKFEYGFYIENGQYKGRSSAETTNRSRNTLGIRDCGTTTTTICIDQPIAFNASCLFEIIITRTTCSDGFSGLGAGSSGGSGAGWLGGNAGSGGGSGWNSNQPANLFSTSEIEALRIKFRNANLDEIFYTLELP